jgi:putative flippase GtrA
MKFSPIIQVLLFQFAIMGLTSTLHRFVTIVACQDVFKIAAAFSICKSFQRKLVRILSF